jgi:predicted aspartyl protease
MSCRPLSPATGLRPPLLAVCLSLMITGCAALSSRPHVASGHPSVAWQATDFRVIARTVEGAERELYTFTLVLDETQGNAITFTQLEHTIYHPGVDRLPASERTAIAWKLRPHSELRQLFYSTPYCAAAHCSTQGRLTPWWHIVLTGSNDHGQPVRMAMNLTWPSHLPAATLGEPPELPGTALPTTAVVSAVVGRAVPFATMGHTVLVHAVLNHQEPVTLLLDTGATRTMLTPDIARRLGLSPAVDAPKSPIVMLGGQRAQMPLIRLASLAVGDSAVTDLQVGVFTPLPRTPFIDGLLGGDFLKRFTLKLDYARSRLQLTPPVTPEPSSGLPSVTSAPVPSTIPLETAGNHILVHAVLNHREAVTLLLDTGATHTMLTPEAARRVGLTPVPRALTGALQVVGGRQVRFPLVSLATLAMGEAVVKNLPVGILGTFPGTRTVDGLLGGDFLEHFTLTLDYSARRLLLAPSGATASAQRL